MLGDVRAQFYALTFFTTIPVLFRLSLSSCRRDGLYSSACARQLEELLL